jgi:hypothetical protein
MHRRRAAPILEPDAPGVGAHDRQENSMTEPTTTTGTASRAHRIGLVLALVLGVLDALSLLLTPPPPPGEPGPPLEVLVASTVLGVITVIAAVWAWRTGSRIGVRIVAGSRILSAITALPAFFVEGVPAGWVILAAVFVLLTAVCVGLLFARPPAG